MGFTFQPIPAKPTFGVFAESMDSSEYLSRKKRKMESYTLLNKTKTNLIANLYFTENLKHVNTISNISNPSNTTLKVNPNLMPFYYFYKIDPDGELFGNSFCGINNYTNYMRPNYVKPKIMRQTCMKMYLNA